MSCVETWTVPGKPVILNNTPLVALWTLGRLDILRDLYREVVIPQAVRDEFLIPQGLKICQRIERITTDFGCWILNHPTIFKGGHCQHELRHYYDRHAKQIDGRCVWQSPR